MLAHRITRYPNVALSVVLLSAVLAAAVVFAFVQLSQPGTTRASDTVANPFPIHRLNELHAYRQSEWGANQDLAASVGPWFDLSRLPAGYVRSEKEGPAARPDFQDFYNDLMAVK